MKNQRVANGIRKGKSKEENAKGAHESTQNKASLDNDANSRQGAKKEDAGRAKCGDQCCDHLYFCAGHRPRRTCLRCKFPVSGKVRGNSSRMAEFPDRESHGQLHQTSILAFLPSSTQKLCRALPPRKQDKGATRSGRKVQRRLGGYPATRRQPNAEPLQ